jgi:sarcosine oxidase gamma subunit
MARASCSQARSLSPTHAAIIAKHLTIELPPSASFFHREKLDCTPAFAQRFLLAPESGIDQTKRTYRLSVIWLSLDEFLVLGARSSESCRRFGVVFGHTSDNPFCKGARDNGIVSYTQVEWILTQGD